MIASVSGQGLGRAARQVALIALAASFALGLAAAPARAAGPARTAGPARAAVTGAVRPPGREWPSFAYDPAHHEFVLFGGDNGSSVFGDTWIHKAGTWTEEAPARSPAPRTGAAVVYDAATSQLLLFGGSARIGTAGGFFGDTWLWTGRAWRKLHPATSPPARHNADMIYDAADQEVVLFGGYDGHYLGDTWAWNGTTWTPLSPATSPSPRDTDSLVYDAATQSAILYGGFNSRGRLSDTWSWDGTTWTQLSPATSPGVVSPSWQAAYDTASGQVILYGGDSGNNNESHETWTWNGSTWTQLSSAAAPPGFGYGAMTYDTASQQPVLFGGKSRQSTYLDRAWAWDGGTWHQGI